MGLEGPGGNSEPSAQRLDLAGTFLRNLKELDPPFLLQPRGFSWGKSKVLNLPSYRCLGTHILHWLRSAQLLRAKSSDPACRKHHLNSGKEIGEGEGGVESNFC